MTRRQALVVVLAGMVAQAAEAKKPKPLATETVDCSKGDSITTAIERNPDAESVLVEIRGVCTEAVVIRRDNVTLRGADPAMDGVRGLGIPPTPTGDEATIRVLPGFGSRT